MTLIRRSPHTPSSLQGTARHPEPDVRYLEGRKRLSPTAPTWLQRSFHRKVTIQITVAGGSHVMHVIRPRIRPTARHNAEACEAGTG